MVTTLPNDLQIVTPPSKVPYLTLPVRLKNVPEKITWQGKTWAAKPEFWVTLVNGGHTLPYVMKTTKKNEAEAIAKMLEAYEAEGRGPVVRLSRITDEFRVVVDGDKRTIVVMARVIGLVELINEVREKLGIVLEVPPAHITLYTAPRKPGIGVSTEEELESLTTIVEGDELKALQRAIQYFKVFG